MPPRRSSENQQKRVLVADDDPAIRELLREYLEDEKLDVTEAGTAREIMSSVHRDTFDAILMDVRLPDLDGLEILERLMGEGYDVPIIIMTAFGTSNTAIQAMQLGAYDYLVKPLERDDVILTLRRLFEHRELASQVRSLEEQLEGRDVRDRIVGQSAPMQNVYKVIGRVAASDATVLITGETGTGKELITDTIHQHSPRRRGPLIKVNCAALTETLLESELFGHEKGAFTTALTQRKGRFELADGGTIFLDEIGELSLGTQRKLLRVLQEGEFERVGGNVTLKVDVRVIAATNKNLENEVAEGRFREDLFYRLNVIRIDLPPLRNRKDDIPLLVVHFLDKYRYAPDAQPTKISEEAMQAVLAYDWPGNVRELENTIQRAVVMSQGRVITSEHLTLSRQFDRARHIDVVEKVRQRVPLEEVLNQVEREMVAEALRQTNGDQGQAAAMLGLPAASLSKKIKTLGLQPA